jgi:hypothetical protein
MPLVTGASLGSYLVLAPLGVGGMSAGGHVEPRTCESEARDPRQFALRVPAFAKATAGPQKLGKIDSERRLEGPSASERMMTPSPCH